jgi:site-specific recombinase XerD
MNFRLAVAGSGIGKPASCHTLRHTFMTHPNVSTTMVYTHVLNRGWGAVRSPADRVLE